MGMNPKNKVRELRKKKEYNFTIRVDYTVQWQILPNYTDLPFKRVREFFLLLASTQSDLTPPCDSLWGMAEDNTTVYRCNADAVLRAAVTGAFASLKP